MNRSYLWTAPQAFLLNPLRVIVHYFCFLCSTGIFSLLAINRYHMLKGLMGFTVLVSDVIGSWNCKREMFEALCCTKLVDLNFSLW